MSSGVWIAGTVSLAATGSAIQTLGLAPALVIGAYLPLLAIVLVAAIRRTAGSLEPAPGAAP